MKIINEYRIPSNISLLYYESLGAEFTLTADYKLTPKFVVEGKRVPTPTRKTVQIQGDKWWLNTHFLLLRNRTG